VWEDQIALYDDLKQFSAGAPKLDDVITTKILEATKDARPKIG
jgi:NitT/TauT family transport system substrate-binding protein